VPQVIKASFPEVETLSREGEMCRDALMGIELYKKFEEAFNKIVSDSELVCF
jgi:hypothetical protein